MVNNSTETPQAHIRKSTLNMQNLNNDITEDDTMHRNCNGFLAKFSFVTNAL